MRGASALERVLEHSRRPLTALVVWEAVLPTDSRPPDAETLGVLHDPRVSQLWDPQHLISKALRAGMQAHPSAIPIDRQRRRGDGDDVLWDAVALFPPGQRWADTLPAPDYLDGDVVDIEAELAKRL